MLLLTLLLASSASAQFGFFDQIFQQQQQQAQHQQQQQAPRNVPSDSEWYQRTYNEAYCDKYLCPGTLACVHFPHHCPCPWPSHEDKIELADGSMICISKGGYIEGEAAKKVELARKGLL